MAQVRVKRDAVRAVAWAVCVALGAVLSAHVWAAEQFAADGTARPGAQSTASQSDAPQSDAPIDVAMAHLRRFEGVAGFDSARLSAAGRNLFSLADRWPVVRERLLKGSAMTTESGQPDGAPVVMAQLPLATNIRNSRYSGFTQSETSTAWCGPNVVIGFNDTGAEVTTMASGRGVSMDGYVVSSNRGVTFTYMGSPATPSDPNTFMSGDPVVACASPTAFYYVSAYFDGTAEISGVSLSTSTDGGQIFGTPVVIAGQSSNSYIVDGAWIAVDPSAPNRIYVTYTDLDFSGSVCGTSAGSAIPRYSIEVIGSADSGTTWTGTPVVVAQVCADPSDPFAFVNGARVAVGPSGEVYVAWESFGSTNSLSSRGIEIAKSTDGGQTFSNPPTLVATITCAGDCADWQGLIHSNENPSLAIGKGPHSGTVYLAWNDGNRQVPDALTTTGVYNFTDVMFSRSDDGGVTWMTPVRVNNNAEGGSAPLTDQFEPALATDVSGRIAICFYDRRNDVNNFHSDRYCASSPYGKSWTNQRITVTSFPSVVGQDILLAPDYMGDYDTLASDGLNRHAGFVGGFATNAPGNPVLRTTQY